MAIGCHSVPLPSPNVGSETEMAWQKNYNWARTNATANLDRACSIFKELAADLRFPGHHLAQIRAYEICTGTEEPTLDPKLMPAYVQPLLIDVMLKVADRRKDAALEMQLAAEKSKQNLPQAEKVKWMQLAIRRARDLKDVETEAQLEKRLYTLAPRLNPAPKSTEYLRIATDLRMARQFSKARSFYERVLKSSAYNMHQKIQALKGLRLSNKNVRDDEAHIESSMRLVKFMRKLYKAQSKSGYVRDALYDAEVYYGRAVWTLGRASEALEVFKNLEKNLKGKMPLAELYWLKGRMAEERGDLDQVSFLLTKASLEKNRDLELRDKILWYQAWNERRRGNLPMAIGVLQRIDEATESEFTRARALYWLGKSLIENKQVDTGREMFQKLRKQDPLGYYGLLAHHELNEPIVAQKTKTVSEPDHNVPVDSVTAQWLAILNEHEALTSLLDISAKAYQRQKSQSDEGWVYLFQHYARAGLYMNMYEKLSLLTADQRRNVFVYHPELLFPQPWLDEAQKAAAQFGISEDLIYSIIRQESAFNMHARSGADAFGVMQLLPEVAEQLSERYKIPYTQMDDLYHPRTNMLLGAAHLKELFARQKGRFILAVASYNASEKAIDNWMKTRFRGNTLEFIEDIPYEETRAYVRLVIRNFTFYNLLNSKGSKIDFPAWVLRLEDGSV